MNEQQCSTQRQFSSCDVAAILAEVKWITEEASEVSRSDFFNEDSRYLILSLYLLSLLDLIQNISSEEK